MKKLFNKDKKKASTGDLSDFHAAQQPGHTLDRIVSLKAEVRKACTAELTNLYCIVVLVVVVFNQCVSSALFVISLFA